MKKIIRDIAVPSVRPVLKFALRSGAACLCVILSLRQVSAHVHPPGDLPTNLNLSAISNPLRPETLNAQRTVRGKVVDKNGLTLIGVSVKLQGTNIGSTTNANGEFIINAPENGLLEISYIGFEKQLIQIGGRTTITVTLLETNANLNEVVVVGYGTTKKIDVTGSIASVKGSDIQNLPVSSVTQALDGRASGVNIVRNDGSPGAASSIRIRGTGTINDSNPLVVIDGVPSSNPDALSDVNPNDIASVEILKDASSSAIYGTRAANGVVLVTTKRGTYSQKLNTTINAYTGISNTIRYLDLLTAPDLYRLKRERYTNDNVAIEAPWDDPYYSAQRTDWQRAILGTGKVNNADISITGGNESSTYYFSTSYYDEKGIIDKAYFKRFSTRINSEHQLKPWIKVGQNIQLTYGESNSFDNLSSQTGLLFSALRFNPAIPTINDDGTYGSSKDFANQLGDINSPYSTIRQNDAYNRKYRAIANVFAEIPIYKDLKFRANYGFDGTIGRGYQFNILDVNQARQTTNSTLTQSETETYSHLLDLFLTYDKTFKKNHITFTGGYSSQNFRGSNFSAARIGYDNATTAQRVLSQGNTLLTAAGTADDPTGLQSVFGRAFYDYDGRFLATLTFRADGSSRFAPGNQWGYFPAFSLGWRISNEEFMKSINWISNLKLTGGWGELGNQNVKPFQYISTVVVGNQYGTNGYTFGGAGANGAAITKTANPNITWERAAMTNVSLEAGFLKNKLNTSVTYFNKNTNDMLIPAVQVGTAGLLTPPDQNIANMNNRGFEVEINYNGGNELKYSIGANASFIKNKVTKLYGSSAFFGSTVYGRSSQEISRTYEGQPIASFYGWKTAGLYQTQAEINADPSLANDSRKSAIKPGDVRFLDVNGDGMIDGRDRTYLGNPNPDATVGLQTSVSYKNFDLAANFTGSFGLSLYNADRMQGIDPTYPFNLYAETINRWTAPGTSNSIPRMTLDRANDNYRTSDLFIESGNYFSLKNLTIGYTVPAALAKKTTLSSFRFYVSSQNVFMLTNYSGFTPELGYTNGNAQRGVDVAQYPSVRSFTFGLTVKL